MSEFIKEQPGLSMEQIHPSILEGYLVQLDSMGLLYSHTARDAEMKGDLDTLVLAQEQIEALAARRALATKLQNVSTSPNGLTLSVIMMYKIGLHNKLTQLTHKFGNFISDMTAPERFMVQGIQAQLDAVYEIESAAWKTFSR